jgi:hypothetical protein
LGLKDTKEWWTYCKSGEKPADIPGNPQSVYKEQWLGLRDWLGTGNPRLGNKSWRSFEDAREFVHVLGLKSDGQWFAYAKSGEKPLDIPFDPRKTYKDQWVSASDWVGNSKAKFSGWRNFEEAREFVRSLGLRNIKEWVEYCKSGERPVDIPTGPMITYREQWAGMRDWLGNAEKWRSFEEARKFVRSLGLRGYKEWHAYCKSGEKPADIPTAPPIVYKEQWKGVKDWLGTKRRNKC